MKLLTHSKPERDILEKNVNLYRFSSVTDEIVTSNTVGCEYCSDLNIQNIELKNKIQRDEKIRQQMMEDFNKTITFQNDQYSTLNAKYKKLIQMVLPILMKIDSQTDNKNTA